MDANFEIECSDCGASYSADEPSCPHCDPQDKTNKTETSAKEENDIARGTEADTNEKENSLRHKLAQARVCGWATGFMIIPLAACAIIFFFVGKGCDDPSDKMINVTSPSGKRPSVIRLGDVEWKKEGAVFKGGEWHYPPPTRQSSESNKQPPVPRRVFIPAKEWEGTIRVAPEDIEKFLASRGLQSTPARDWVAEEKARLGEEEGEPNFEWKYIPADIEAAKAVEKYLESR